MSHDFCGNYDFCILFLQKRRKGNNGNVNFARVSQHGLFIVLCCTIPINSKIVHSINSNIFHHRSKQNSLISVCLVCSAIYTLYIPF